MSNDQTTTTGTPVRDDSEQVVQTPEPGTPEAEGRDAKSEVENLKALLAAQKEKIEEANRVLREREEAAAQTPAARDGQIADEEQRRLSRIVRLQAAADAGDPAAEEALEAMREREAQRAAIEYDRRERAIEAELLRMPPEKEQAVRAHIAANPKKFGSVQVALDNMEAAAIRKRNQELEAENARLKQKPDDSVLNAPPTQGREYTARDTTKEWTEDAFDAEAERIRTNQGELAALKFLQTAPNKWKR